MLRFLARVVALLGAILFVPVAVATLFFQAAGTRLAQASTYKEMLDREQFYAKAPAVLAETVSRAVETGLAAKNDADATAGASALLHQLKRADLETLLAAVLPPAVLRPQVEGALDQFAGYLHDASARPSVRISLVEFKQRMTGGELEAAYVGLLRRKPAFTAGMAEELLPLAYCPTEAQLPPVRERFRQAMSLLADQIPASVDLLDEVVQADRSGNTQAALDYTRLKVQEYEAIARWSPVVPALLLLLILLFGVRSLRGLLLWVGFPCLLAGAFGALLALPSAAGTRWLFSVVIEPQLPPQIPSLLLDTVVGLLTSALEVILHAVLISSAWLGLGGLIAVLLGFLCPRRSAP